MKAKATCPECDLLFDKTNLSPKEEAVCPRCSTVLYYGGFNFQTAIALLISAFMLYFPAVFLPFLSMELSGQVKEISIWQSISLNNDSLDLKIALSLIIFTLVVLAPLLRLVGLIFIVIPIYFRWPIPFDRSLIRFFIKLGPWSMGEVYLIAVVVTLVKLSHLAEIGFSSGFFAFCLFIIVNSAVNLNMPAKKLWKIIDEA